jgi:aminoglycoside phosphotransferase (APT) family kinase protein
LIRPVLEDASAFLTAHAVHRLHVSFQRVNGFSGRYPAGEACFVHGDFHHGNIIVERGNVVGFIDLDWCRAGHPLEDLGFTMMMLLRDYDTWSPTFRRQRYDELLSLYRYNSDLSVLNDYIILYALFDCDCFKNAAFKSAEDFHTYQKSFLETLCRERVLT